MKKILFVWGVLLSAISTSAQHKVELKNSTDSLTYAMGVTIGNVFKINGDKIPGGVNKIDSVKMGYVAGIHTEASYALGLQYAIESMMRIKGMSEQNNVNTQILLKAFNDALVGSTDLLMSVETANAFPQSYKSPSQQAEIDKQLAENKRFFDSNKKVKGVVTTKSGLQFKIIKKSKGQVPTATDVVKVNYRGTLLDGTEFDKGDSIEFPAGNLIAGFTEGLQLMPIGAKYIFYIPSNLGYGDHGAGEAVKPNSALIFEVELLEIVKKEDSNESPEK